MHKSIYKDLDLEEIKKNTVFQILNKLINPSFVCLEDGKILFASKSYQALLSKNPENEIFWSLYPFQGHIPDCFMQAINQHNEINTQTMIEDKTFDLRIVPVNDIIKKHSMYIVYFEDITERINFNNQLQMEKKSLQRTFLDTILAFSNFVESRDYYTSGHQKRVALLALNIAYKANIRDDYTLSSIYYGALMHDIGKIAIPIEYLVTSKHLTPIEMGVVRSHVAVGNHIIQHMDFPWDIKSVIYQHHERLDGTGYPEGIKKNEISLSARIVAIADVYEAMSTNRPYRHLIPQKHILNYLSESKDTLFESAYVNSLFQCLEELHDIYQIIPQFKPFELY